MQYKIKYTYMFWLLTMNKWLNIIPWALLSQLKHIHLTGIYHSGMLKTQSWLRFVPQKAYNIVGTKYMLCGKYYKKDMTNSCGITKNGRNKCRQIWKGYIEDMI